MAIWHSFLPFGLSIAICVFVSWKSVENQLELRADDSVGARQRGTGEGDDDDDDDIGEAFGAAAAAPLPQTQPRHRRLRPPRTASELRARLQTLSRMAPGPRRLARGRALALAAERALREASPGGGGAEEGDGEGSCDDPAAFVVVESHAAAALRQTLPWLDARLAALAIEDARAEACGPCEICAGFDDARATHAWPCGGGGGGGGQQRRGEAEGGQGGGGSGLGGGGLGGLLAALFGNAPSSAASFSPKSSDSVYTTSRHRACGRCSSKCGARCPWCRREEGPPRLAFLECAAATAASS